MNELDQQTLIAVDLLVTQFSDTYKQKGHLRPLDFLTSPLIFVITKRLLAVNEEAGRELCSLAISSRSN